MANFFLKTIFTLGSPNLLQTEAVQVLWAYTCLDSIYGLLQGHQIYADAWNRHPTFVLSFPHQHLDIIPLIFHTNFLN